MGTVLDVSYNANDRPEVLGRLIATTDGVFGQLYSGGWPACTDGAGTELMDDDETIIGATAGSIGFDSNYQTNDVYFAAVSGTANVDGVSTLEYRRRVPLRRRLGRTDCRRA